MVFKSLYCIEMLKSKKGWKVKRLHQKLNQFMPDFFVF